MSQQEAHKILVIGAGIAGCSAAYFLQQYSSSFIHGVSVIVSDPRPAGSLTSAASTECYRNWWTEQTMVNFVKKSIELYEIIDEKSNGIFKMNKSGYLFMSSSPQIAEKYRAESLLCEGLGSGPSRLHTLSNLSNYTPCSSLTPVKESQKMTGIDVITNSSSSASFSQSNWPAFHQSLSNAKHVRNCGWIVVQEYLNYINQQSCSSGKVKFLKDYVDLIEFVEGDSGKKQVKVNFGSGNIESFDQVVLAVGPDLRRWLGLLLASPSPLNGSIIPKVEIILEIHAKVLFRDPLKVVPRGAPLLLFDDPVTLDWAPEQITYLSNHPELNYLLQPFKGGVHCRPLGGNDSDLIVGIWTYNTDVLEESNHDQSRLHVPETPYIDDYYGEIVLRGLSKFIPGLAAYAGANTNPLSKNNPNIVQVHAGYYCKTPENRPLIGPLHSDDQRLMLLGALSGFGIMTSPAAGDLIAQYCANYASSKQLFELPSYTSEFLISRYQDPTYLAKMEQNKGNHGQL